MCRFRAGKKYMMEKATGCTVCTTCHRLYAGDGRHAGCRGLGNEPLVNDPMQDTDSDDDDNGATIDRAGLRGRIPATLAAELGGGNGDECFRPDSNTVIDPCISHAYMAKLADIKETFFEHVLDQELGDEERMANWHFGAGMIDKVAYRSTPAMQEDGQPDRRTTQEIIQTRIDAMYTGGLSDQVAAYIEAVATRKTKRREQQALADKVAARNGGSIDTDQFEQKVKTGRTKDASRMLKEAAVAREGGKPPVTLAKPEEWVEEMTASNPETMANPPNAAEPNNPVPIKYVDRIEEARRVAIARVTCQRIRQAANGLNTGKSGGRTGTRAEHMIGQLECSKSLVRTLGRIFKYVLAKGLTDYQNSKEEVAVQIRRSLTAAALQPMTKPVRQNKDEAKGGEAATKKRKCRTFGVTPVLMQILSKVASGDYDKNLHEVCWEYVTTSDANACQNMAVMAQLYMDGTKTEARRILEIDCEREDEHDALDRLPVVSVDDAVTFFCTTGRTTAVQQIVEQGTKLRGMLIATLLMMGSEVDVTIYAFDSEEIIKRKQRGGGTIGERTAGAVAKLVLAMEVKETRRMMQENGMQGSVTGYADNLMYMGTMREVWKMRQLMVEKSVWTFDYSSFQTLRTLDHGREDSSKFPSMRQLHMALQRRYGEVCQEETGLDTEVMEQCAQTAEGTVLFGIPIGTTEFRRRALRVKAADLANVYQMALSMTNVDLALLWRVIHDSVSQLSLYVIGGSMPCTDVHDFARECDAALFGTISRLMTRAGNGGIPGFNDVYDIDEMTQNIFTLPSSDKAGGLGMSSAEKMYLETPAMATMAEAIKTANRMALDAKGSMMEAIADRPWVQQELTRIHQEAGKISTAMAAKCKRRVPETTIAMITDTARSNSHMRRVMRAIAIKRRVMQMNEETRAARDQARETQRVRTMFARAARMSTAGAGKALEYSTMAPEVTLTGRAVVMTFFHASGRPMPGGGGDVRAALRLQKTHAGWTRTYARRRSR